MKRFDITKVYNLKKDYYSEFKDKMLVHFSKYTYKGITRINLVLKSPKYIREEILKFHGNPIFYDQYFEVNKDLSDFSFEILDDIFTYEKVIGIDLVLIGTDLEEFPKRLTRFNWLEISSNDKITKLPDDIKFKSFNSGCIMDDKKLTYVGTNRKRHLYENKC